MSKKERMNQINSFEKFIKIGLNLTCSFTLAITIISSFLSLVFITFLLYTSGYTGLSLITDRVLQIFGAILIVYVAFTIVINLFFKKLNESNKRNGNK